MPVIPINGVTGVPSVRTGLGILGTAERKHCDRQEEQFHFEYPPGTFAVGIGFLVGILLCRGSGMGSTPTNLSLLRQPSR